MPLPRSSTSTCQSSGLRIFQKVPRFWKPALEKPRGKIHFGISISPFSFISEPFSISSVNIFAEPNSGLQTAVKYKMQKISSLFFSDISSRSQLVSRFSGARVSNLHAAQCFGLCQWPHLFDRPWPGCAGSGPWACGWGSRKLCLPGGWWSFLFFFGHGDEKRSSNEIGWFVIIIIIMMLDTWGSRWLNIFFCFRGIQETQLIELQLSPLAT